MEKLEKYRRRAWQIVETARDGDHVSRIFDIFILSLIFLNIVAVIIETVEPVRAAAPAFFQWLEYVSIAIFSVEYIVRLWASTTKRQYSRPVLGRIRYAVTPMMLIDLLAIAPFFVAMAGDFRAIRVLRLFRLFRVIKVARYSKAVRTLGNVLYAKREELVVTVFVLIVLLVLASSLIYHVENKAQPEAFGSIPHAMWWTIITLTTVGYGDVQPITPLGKLFASVIAILGIGLFAIPTGILGGGFVEEMQKKKSASGKCPHCGKELHF